MRLRFALAINNENSIEKMHFGDAERFLIYTLEEGKMILSSEETNDFQIMDDESEHELNRKGAAIVHFLKEKNVHVLVSGHFCSNIKWLNEYFIPVVVMHEQKDHIIDMLNKHQHWIQDEWENNSSGFKLFTLGSGILKTPIATENAEDCAF